jgi:hypothetical protein
VQEVVVDSRLEAKFAEVETAQQAYEEEQEAEAQIMDMLNELAKICAAEDADAIFSYMESDAYAGICASVYFAFDTKYETRNGALGLYENGEYLYYGEYDGEQRSGQGAWYCSDDTYAVGAWVDDKPNGTQRVFWSCDAGYGDSVSGTIEGTVVDGLWDGNVVETYSELGVDTWDFTYENGMVDVIEMYDNDEDYPYVVSKIVSEDGWSTCQMSKEQIEETYGIFGFADALN